MSAPDTIIVMRSPGETRSALLAGDDLVEVVHRRDGEIAPGSVRAGRVVGHVSGFAFIDIGDTQPGVLKVKAPLVEGTKLSVRVIVPARGDKGAELARASAEEAHSEPAAVWFERYRDSIEQVLASPPAEARRLKTVIANAPLRDGGPDPFASRGVDEAIEGALNAVIPLAGGGRVTVEATAAAICIDIDAGAAPALEINIAAVSAIARSLRLRNLAGHILIDVIPGARGGAKAFAAKLKEAVSSDPVPVQIAGTTPLGMVELTRRREGLSLAEALADPIANTCYAILRRAVRVAVDGRVARVRIAGSEAIAARLLGPYAPAVEEARAMAACEIAIERRADWAAARAECAPG